MVHGREGELSLQLQKESLLRESWMWEAPMHLEDGGMACGDSPWLQLCLECQHQICDLHSASIIAAHEGIHCFCCRPENHTAWQLAQSS